MSTQVPLWQSSSKDTRTVIDSSTSFCNNTYISTMHEGKPIHGKIVQKFNKDGVDYVVVEDSSGNLSTIKNPVLFG